ncbi:glycosyltransferase family 2 protein [Novosphingobium rosa]|uniref:glycosyltransferase family 2 protein n=1 Tax=Novosphingobium rosa TaxID=76978 RepID=UPI0008323C41|nr:glycosyltransferase [Novosphingobium rosa]
MTVTVAIKALNEEAHIAAALDSALAEVAPLGGHVVLGDSGSRDGTIPTAQSYPRVTIVQLADPAQRCCGAGAQLAFQGALKATDSDDYLYLLDGDMVLQPGMLAAGIAFLQDHPQHAAVAGQVIEANTQSIEFEARARNDKAKRRALVEEVDRLDCGGLYRLSALRDLGYFADRNLHAFEEFDLGARLTARGWKLARIDVPGVRHHGHDMGGLPLIWKRITSGYAGGTGEVVRAAMEQGRLPEMLRGFSHLRHAIMVVGWWAFLLLSLLAGWWWLLLFALAAPVAFLGARRRSLRHGIYSVATWNMHAIGLLQGLGRKRVPPRQPLDMVVLQDGAA